MQLTFWSIFATPQWKAGRVAQLDRASDYGSEGLGFESLRGHKEPKKALQRKLRGFFISKRPKLASGRRGNGKASVQLQLRRACWFGIWSRRDLCRRQKSPKLASGCRGMEKPLYSFSCTGLVGSEFGAGGIFAIIPRRPLNP